MSTDKMVATQERLGSKILLEAGTNELEVLVFHLNGERYGVNGAKVREVVSPPRVRPVPGTHEAVDGMCKLRDQVLPMVNLGKYLGITPTNEAIDYDHSQIVVTVFNEQSIAFRVDQVDRIYRVSWKAVEPMPELFGKQQNQFTSMTVIDNEMILLVDLEKIAEEISGHQAKSASATRFTNKPLTGMSVVYAEDSEMIQELTSDLLRAAGVADLVVFNNGQDAWNWVQANAGATKIDIIVSDIEMPLMDGLHLTAKIRGFTKTRDIPILLLSSLINPENEKKGKAVGANAQLVKKQIHRLPAVVQSLVS